MGENFGGLNVIHQYYFTQIIPVKFFNAITDKDLCCHVRISMALLKFRFVKFSDRAAVIGVKPTSNIRG